MKGEITQAGRLEIERAGKLKIVECPFNDLSCGDWCPLFRDDENGAIKLMCSTTSYIIEITADHRQEEADHAQS